MLENLRTSTAGARLLAAGPTAGVSVALGGLTLGFFAWYELIIHADGLLAINDLMLLLSLVAGVGVALTAWYRYSVAMAQRSPLPLRTILRIDAWSWLGLLVFWLGFMSPLGAQWAGRSVAIGIGLFALAKLVAATVANYTVREVTSTFLVTRVPLFIIAELAAAIIGQRAGTHVSVSNNPLLAVWGRWDAVHYVDIATRGYFGTDMAFFPLYPALISVLGLLIGNHVIAGLLISNVAFFFGLLFLFRIVELQYDRRVAHRATFYISIFPTAIFFSAVYTESLFFALTVGAFYCIRKRLWIAAGVLGFFAALTRVEGILLIAPMLLETFARERKSFLHLLGWTAAGLVAAAFVLDLSYLWHQHGAAQLVSLIVALALFAAPAIRQSAGSDFAARERRWSLFASALTVAGLSLYMTYLWVLQGDPLFFSHVQINWGRHLAPPWASIMHSFAIITTSLNGSEIANQCLEVAFTCFMVLVLLGSLREMPRSYAVYTALSVLVPMSTSSLMSMPRFALVLFPLFIALAHWGRRSTVNNAIVSFSLPLLGLFTVLFADWYWVA